MQAVYLLYNLEGNITGKECSERAGKTLRPKTLEELGKEREKKREELARLEADIEILKLEIENKKGENAGK